MTFKAAESGERGVTEMPDLLPVGMSVLADCLVPQSDPLEGTSARTLLTFDKRIRKCCEDG